MLNVQLLISQGGKVQASLHVIEIIIGEYH